MDRTAVRLLCNSPLKLEVKSAFRSVGNVILDTAYNITSHCYYRSENIPFCVDPLAARFDGLRPVGDDLGLRFAQFAPVAKHAISAPLHSG